MFYGVIHLCPPFNNNQLIKSVHQSLKKYNQKLKLDNLMINKLFSLDIYLVYKGSLNVLINSIEKSVF